jgi:putative colanic acid biosynthesis acetyltransferase WcaF
MLLDAAKSKPIQGGPSFSLGNRLFRVTWTIGWLVLARWTPAPLHRWRRFVLVLFGANIARSAHIYPSVKVWYPPHLTVANNAVIGPRVNCYTQGRVTIGEHAIVSQGAHLCTGSHDITDPNFQLFTKPIMVQARAWVAAEAFVGPGVTVGEGAVLGARGVTFHDLDPWTVYVGNPAKLLKKRMIRSSHAVGEGAA